MNWDWKKPSQRHKPYLLCITQTLSLFPAPFRLNPIIDFISLFDGWFLLTVGSVIFIRISDHRDLFSFTFLQGMLLSWKKSHIEKNRSYFTISWPSTTSSHVPILWFLWSWSTVSVYALRQTIVQEILCTYKILVTQCILKYPSVLFSLSSICSHWTESTNSVVMPISVHKHQKLSHSFSLPSANAVVGHSCSKASTNVSH